MMRGANLLLMFLLELGVYASVVLWATTVSPHVVVQITVAVVGFAAFAGVWAALAAPKARHPVHGIARMLVEVVWFGGGAAGMALAGHPIVAAVLAALFVLNAAGRRRWGGLVAEPAR